MVLIYYIISVCVAVVPIVACFHICGQVLELLVVNTSSILMLWCVVRLYVTTPILLCWSSILYMLFILPLCHPPCKITSTTSPSIPTSLSIGLSIWNLWQLCMLHLWRLIPLWWELFVLWIMWRLSCFVWALCLAWWDSWILNKIHHVHLVL